MTTTTTNIPPIGDEEWGKKAEGYNQAVIDALEKLIDHAGPVSVITLLGTAQDFVITCIPRNKSHAN